MALIIRILQRSNMEFPTLFGSVITSASILVSVGLGFLIFEYTRYQNRKIDFLYQMRSFYPKFDAFRELIYQVFQTDLWKNKDVVKKYKASVQKCNEGEIKELIKENEFLKLYRSYLYISDKYSKEVFSEAKSIYSYKELNIYKKNANYIWYAINCRTDFKIEMNDNCFKDIDDFTLKKMKKNINKIGTGITYNNITLDLIADISELCNFFSVKL